jgi:hypothetical protein
MNRWVAQKSVSERILVSVEYCTSLKPRPGKVELVKKSYSVHASSYGLLLGFPFYVKKLFTRNIVTDGYYVVITIVTT